MRFVAVVGVLYDELGYSRGLRWVFYHANASSWDEVTPTTIDRGSISVQDSTFEDFHYFFCSSAALLGNANDIGEVHGWNNWYQLVYTGNWFSRVMYTGRVLQGEPAVISTSLDRYGNRLLVNENGVISIGTIDISKYSTSKWLAGFRKGCISKKAKVMREELVAQLSMSGYFAKAIDGMSCFELPKRSTVMVSGIVDYVFSRDNSSLRDVIFADYTGNMRISTETISRLKAPTDCDHFDLLASNDIKELILPVRMSCRTLAWHTEFSLSLRGKGSLPTSFKVIDQSQYMMLYTNWIDIQVRNFIEKIVLSASVSGVATIDMLASALRSIKVISNVPYIQKQVAIWLQSPQNGIVIAVLCDLSRLIVTVSDVGRHSSIDINILGKVDVLELNCGTINGAGFVRVNGATPLNSLVVHTDLGGNPVVSVSSALISDTTTITAPRFVKLV